MKKHPFPRWLNRAGALAALGGAVLGLAILSSGCSDSESQTAVVTGVASTGAEAAIPTLSLDELPSSLQLTPEQSTELDAAIDQLNSDRQRLHEEFGRGRRGGRVGERIRRSMGADFEPPMLTFLESSSRILNADQFQILCEHLVSNRPDPQHERGWDHHQGRNAWTSLLATELGLSEEQIERGIDRRLENLEEQLARRADFLTRVLQLSDDQAQRVEQVLSASIPQRERTLKGVQDGTIPPQVAVMMGLQLEQQILADIKAILNEDQITRLEALADLIPRGLKLGGSGGRFGAHF